MFSESYQFAGLLPSGSKNAEAQGWKWILYGFLTAYIIEMVAIYVLHKMTHVKFELIEDNKQHNK